MNTWNGHPFEAARKLNQSQHKAKVYVVGVQVKASGQNTLAQMATVGKGFFANATDPPICSFTSNVHIHRSGWIPISGISDAKHMHFSLHSRESSRLLDAAAPFRADLTPCLFLV